MARSFSLVAQMIEFFRGSRVEAYGPVLDLLSRLLLPGRFLVALGDGGNGKAKEERSKEGAGEPVEEEEEEQAHLRRASVTEQALRVMVAVVAGHAKVVGASQGMWSLIPRAGEWDAVWTCSPAGEILAAARAVVSGPGGAEAVACFLGPSLLGGLGVVLESVGGDVLPVLLDVVRIMRPPGQDTLGQGKSLPVLLTARPGGRRLAANVRR